MISFAQLRALEDALKRLWMLDDVMLDAAIKQMNRAEEGAQADPLGTFAGTLYSIEQACKLLRGRLNVELTAASQVEMTSILADDAGNMIDQGTMTHTDSRPIE